MGVKSTDDTITARLQSTEGEPVRRTYVVKAKDGLFKRGQLYKEGDEIELDEPTAANFLRLKQIESLK